jgi:hypothetical protein
VRALDATCRLLLLGDPGSAFLGSRSRVRAGVYQSHDLCVSELAVMSDIEIWGLLEHLSHGRIRRSIS